MPLKPAEQDALTLTLSLREREIPSGELGSAHYTGRGVSVISAGRPTSKALMLKARQA